VRRLILLLALAAWADREAGSVAREEQLVQELQGLVREGG